MIIELFDAIDAMLTALFVWLVIGAMVGTIVLLAGLACGTWAVKRAWRVFGPHARRAVCAPAGAPHSPPRDSGVTETPPEALSGHTEPRPTPAWSKT